MKHLALLLMVFACGNVTGWFARLEMAPVAVDPHQLVVVSRPDHSEGEPIVRTQILKPFCVQVGDDVRHLSAERPDIHDTWLLILDGGRVKIIATPTAR